MSSPIPRWMQEEYGWDRVSDVNWNMLRHNLKSLEHIQDNPAKFPKANPAEIEWKSNELFVFLASHLQLEGEVS
jgi:hypothetical protein